MAARPVAFVLACIGLLALSFIGVVGGCRPSTSYYEAYVEMHLSEGNSFEVIEEFLDREGWVWNYDRFSKRYSAGPPQYRGRNPSLAIYIYTDEEKRFLRVEAHWIWTAI